MTNYLSKLIFLCLKLQLFYLFVSVIWGVEISANLWSLIVFSTAFQTHCGHLLNLLGTMVTLVVGILPITILSTKKVSRKMLFTLLQLLYHHGFCHCCMIQLSKWFKLVTTSSYSKFTGKKLYLWSPGIMCYLFFFVYSSSHFIFMRRDISFNFFLMVRLHKLTSSLCFFWLIIIFVKFHYYVTLFMYLSCKSKLKNQEL